MPLSSALVPDYLNIKNFGGVGDGVHDDSTPLANILAAANAASVGAVFLPPGTYLTGNQTLYSNVHIFGAGSGISVLKLKNGSNVDLLSANTSYINLSATFGTSNVGGITNWGLHDLTLDGNYLNQSAGPSYCLRVYGYAYQLKNVEILHGYSGGAMLDWNGGDILTDREVECFFSGLRVSSNGGEGFVMGGPHDSAIDHSVFMQNAFNNIHFAPNATGILVSDVHSWGANYGVGAAEWVIEANGVQCSNCIGEGSDTCNVVILADDVMWQDSYVYQAGANTVGIQLGQLGGQTPYPFSINQSGGLTTAKAANRTIITGKASNCVNGAVNFVNEAHSQVQLLINQSSGVYITGTPDVTTAYNLVGNGLTSDGTLALGGGTLIPSESFFAFTVSDGGTDWFRVNTHVGSHRVEFPNGVHLRTFSDNYLTPAIDITNETISFGPTFDAFLFRANTGTIAVNGGFALGPSASVNALASSGTITTLGAGIARVSTSGAVTGVILQAGVWAGQLVIVENTSANLITFATSGTSNVAQGAAASIPATTSQLFAWDNDGLLWYQIANFPSPVPVANGGTGTSAAFTAGSVLFAGASGIYNQDNAKIFWDDTNFRLGIGNAAPSVDLHVSGRGLFKTNNANTFTVNDGTNDVVNVNAASSNQRLEIPNGAKLRMFSDAYSTATLDISGGTISWGSAFDTYIYRYAANILALSGTIALGSSGAAATIASSGTITTSGIGQACITSTGNITGVILQAGIAPGQHLIVINQGSFTVTFAASGTSHVAGGASVVIAATSKAIFSWDANTSLWY